MVLHELLGLDDDIEATRSSRASEAGTGCCAVTETDSNVRSNTWQPILAFFDEHLRRTGPELQG